MAADRTIRSLYHDPEYYAKCFRKCAEKSSKFQALAHWFDFIFPDVVFEKLKLVNSNSEAAFRMLGVGSGSGETDLMMISHLRKLFPSIQNVAMEPTPDLVDKYRSLFKEKQHLLEGVETEWREQTLEGFQSSVGSTVSYHFISAVNSLYYVDDYRARLHFLYDCLEDGGVMLIIMLADDSGFARLWRKLPYLEDSRMKFINSEHVRKALDDMGVKYQSLRQRSRVVATECFKADSEAGNLVLDFLTHVLHFRKTAPPELQKEVLDYLETDCCDPRNEDGEILFNNDRDTIIVQKPAH
ncbi:histamine N-methyltransferase A-like [Ptychodera flava]|uniref:histamine N-methyltransferase A-like n=1 Tax=Ptychodera flava TaxID=63121 RepID=UPI00396A72DA